MQLILLLIMCFVNKSLELCVYKGEENSLKCEKVAFSDAIAQYSDVKDVIFSAALSGCDKPSLNNNEIPFPNVDKLSLSCDIETLSPDAFTNLPNLHVLNLSENKISSIPNNLFQTLTSSLEALLLSRNRLRNPTVDTFYYLNTLQTLDVSFNRITNIDLGVLDVLNNLRQLNASYNGLYKLPLGVFDEVLHLETLDLSYNNLQAIPLGVFDRPTKLTRLYLAGNKFTIELGTLDGLKNLKQLDLSASKLRGLPLGVFDELTLLNHLSLSGNALENLTLGLFDKLETLVTLELSSCVLKVIPNGLLDKNKLLEHLDLSRNELATLEDGTLDDTKRLKHLNLSHNKLDALPKNLFQQTELETVDLSFNQMERVQPGLFNVETLTKVVLKGNRIEFLDSEAFTAKGSPLRSLDVSKNRLVCLEPEFFNAVPNLERFKIVGNPWDCKQLDTMITLMISRFISYRTRDYFQGQKAVCVTPEGALKRCTYDKIAFQAYYDIFSGA